MSNHRLCWTVLAVIVFCVVSCATTDIKVQKQREEALRNLGEAYYKQGDYTSALKQFLEAQELYPDDPFLQTILD